MWIIIGLAVVLILLLISCLEVVKENTVFVVEFLGKFDRIMTAGLNLRLPLIESVVEKVSLRQQNFSITGRYPSKDSIVVDVATNLIFSVIPSAEGVSKYVYTLDDRDRSIAAALENSIRTYISRHTHQEILEKKEELNQHIRNDLERQFKEWGINIVSFQIVEIHLSNNLVQM